MDECVGCGWGKIRGLLGAAVLTLMAALPCWAQGGETIAEFVGNLRIGEPQHFEGLTVVPIFADGPHCGGGPASLEQGLADGWLRIVEKDGGQVPTVLLSNFSDRTVFVMAGEILSGCKQDRIVARDLLVRPWRKNLAVPVYCVEEGRWHPKSGSFASEKNLGTFGLRAKAQAAKPQEEIWAQVAGENRKAGVESGTGALQDAFRDERVEARLRKGEGALGQLPQRFPSAVGVAVALADGLVGLDLFASPALFAELWPKILRSAVLGLVGTPGQADVRRADVERLLALMGVSQDDGTAATVGWNRRSGVDLGEELFRTAGGWDFHALAGEAKLQEVVHIAAFPAQPAVEASGPALLRPVPRASGR